MSSMSGGTQAGVVDIADIAESASRPLSRASDSDGSSHLTMTSIICMLASEILVY